MTSRLRGLLLGCALCAATPARAEPEAPEADLLAMSSAPARRVERRYDYSRFDNGPRRVPKPRGASLERAERLGIGSLEATRDILRGRIGPALLGEVPGEAPRKLLWPVVGGSFGRGFGYTRKTRKDLRHNGVDVGAPAGAVVRAAASGLVVYSDNTLRGMGNAVVILHPGGLTTLYAHNSRNTVQPGWRVKRGERIALVGATGIARGPHLHFELRENGRLRDPARRFIGKRSDELAGPLVDLEAAAGERPVTAEGDVATDDEGAPAGVGETSTTEGTPAWSFPLGDVAAARAALANAPELSEAEEARLGRRFRDLLWPVKGGELTRPHAADHTGIDIMAAPGAAVRAAADGLVVYAGEGLPGYGRVVVLLHRGGWLSLYGAQADLAVEAGAQVLRGEWIGHVGTTEAEPRPHLHFEWRVAGQARDPADHFAGAPTDAR